MPEPVEHDRDQSTSAFRALFEAQLPYVLRSLRRLGIPERDLEDVAQEVFVRVHERLDERDPTRSARPWIFAFCARLASNHRRLARHRTALDGARIDQRGQSGEDPQSHAIRNERRQLLLDALAELPFERRVVVVMHDIDGFAAPEIAAQLDVPLNTVYSRIRLGRRDLAAAVRALRGGEP